MAAGLTQVAKYGRKPSKLGTIGAEFATILTVIDSRGYYICKVVVLGCATPDSVIDLYERASFAEMVFSLKKPSPGFSSEGALPFLIFAFGQAAWSFLTKRFPHSSGRRFSPEKA